MIDFGEAHVMKVFDSPHAPSFGPCQSQKIPIKAKCVCDHVSSHSQNTYYEADSQFEIFDACAVYPALAIGNFALCLGRTFKPNPSTIKAFILNRICMNRRRPHEHDTFAETCYGSCNRAAYHSPQIWGLQVALGIDQHQFPLHSQYVL